MAPLVYAGAAHDLFDGFMLLLTALLFGVEFVLVLLVAVHLLVLVADSALAFVSGHDTDTLGL